MAPKMHVSAPHASSPPRKRGSRGERYLLADLVVQIPPGRIGFLDEFELLSSAPRLYAFFPQDRFLHGGVKLGVDKRVNTVSAGETFDDLGPVFPDPAAEVACYADIEGSVPAAREDIDAGLHKPPMIGLFREAWTPAFAGMSASVRTL
jgi:hypothetical protein